MTGMTIGIFPFSFHLLFPPVSSIPDTAAEAGLRVLSETLCCGHLCLAASKWFQGCF